MTPLATRQVPVLDALPTAVLRYTALAPRLGSPHTPHTTQHRHPVRPTHPARVLCSLVTFLSAPALGPSSTALTHPPSPAPVPRPLSHPPLSHLWGLLSHPAPRAARLPSLARRDPASSRALPNLHDSHPRHSASGCDGERRCAASAASALVLVRRVGAAPFARAPHPRSPERGLRKS